MLGGAPHIDSEALVASNYRSIHITAPSYGAGPAGIPEVACTGRQQLAKAHVSKKLLGADDFLIMARSEL
jgi:hypothetical protein